MLITPKLLNRGVDTTPKALCISIYPEMTEAVTRESEKLGVPVDVYEGGIFNNGHFFAQEAQGDYEVIISQAGTAACIQQMVQVPVVSIGITSLDFITTFEKASRHNKPLTLITYKSELGEELSAMARFFTPERFSVVTYSNREEFQNIVDHALLLKDSAFVGFGGCITELAEENGIPYELVRSRLENIRRAILSAKNIIEQNIREKTHMRRLQNLVNHSREGILSINNQKNITICNITAKRLLKLKGLKALGVNITDPDAPASLRALYDEGGFTLNTLKQIDGKRFIVSRIPVVVRSRLLETVITFQELSQIQKVEARARAQLHLKGLVARYTFKDIISECDSMRKLVADAKEYAATQAAVLIEGETGTGKELTAQSIHNASSRKEGPFVAINCAALPEHLLESELFGYEGGAFTGAKKGGKPGVFELAHNGTIFLDEIGELPLPMQGRLLRVLQEKEVFRLGGDRIINVDVRVISATNKNLYKRVEEGSFRRDLFFRLNMLPLFIPPLRERLEALPPLAHYFLGKSASLYGVAIPTLAKATLKKMQAYEWPGNIRELSNIIERLCIMYKDGQDADELAVRILEDHIAMQRRSLDLHQDAGVGTITIPTGTMEEMKSAILRAMLDRFGGNQKLLTERLGISRVTVWKKIKEIAALEKVPSLE